MRKESQTQAKVQCMRGTTIKIYAPLLWAATLIGLSGGYFTPPARLSSLHCMVYVTFCLCTWGAQLCFCHDSSQVFAPFNSFLFFFNCVYPQDSPPPQARPRTSTYMEGIQIRKSKGALHAVLVHILWVEVSPKTASLVQGI